MSYLGLPVHFTVTPTGNVGIGSSQPRCALDVRGDIYATGNLTGSNLTIFGDTVTLATITSNTERVVITNNTPGPALTVRQAGSGVGYAVFECYDDDVGGGVALKVADGGNVGIGTSTPNYKLHVTGTISGETLLGNAAGVTGLAASAYVNATNATNITTGTLGKDRVASVLNGVGFAGAVGVGSTAPRQGSDLDVAGPTTFTLPVFPPRALTASVTNVTNAPHPRLNGQYTIEGSFTDLVGDDEAWYVTDGNSNTAWRTKTFYNPQFDSAGDPSAPISEYRTFVNNTINPFTQGDPVYGNFLTLTLPNFALIKGYTITRSDTLNETLGSWHLLGSSNAIEWRYLDTKTNYAWGANTRAHVSISNQTYYRYYRLVITANAAGDGVTARVSRMREWQLFGDIQEISGVRLYEPFSVWQNQGSTVPILSAEMDTARVGVGTTNPQEQFHIQNGAIRMTSLAGVTTRSISVNAQGNIVLTTSDENMKENIKPLRAGAIELNQLRPVSFYWKDKVANGSGQEYGLIAQEVGKIFPHMVSTNVDGTMSLDYVKLIPVLIKGYQEMLAEIEMLKSRLR